MLPKTAPVNEGCCPAIRAVHRRARSAFYCTAGLGHAAELLQERVHIPENPDRRNPIAAKRK